jgi:hypothetical protein
MRYGSALAATSALLLATTAALSQSGPPPQAQPHNPLGASAAQLEEADIRARLTETGHSDISELRRLGSEWIATARQGGQRVQAVVDATGTVRSAMLNIPKPELEGTPHALDTPAAR